MLNLSKMVNLISTQILWMKSIIFFIFFIVYRSLCSHSMLIIGLWGSNPITEALETLYSVPIIYLVRYCIPHIFDY